MQWTNRNSASADGTRRQMSAVSLLALAVAWLMSSSFPLAADAKVVPAEVFGSHMVLQQNMPVPVWGTADAGEEVTVSFAGQSVKTKADASGKWEVKLAALKLTKDHQGQPMTVAGSNTITFEDVLVGEVWLCSGQSNMRWFVGQSNNAHEEIANANYPQIRIFTVRPTRPSREPLDTVPGNWTPCSPSMVKNVSGTAYYFGRKLHQDLGVPVGLIVSAEGGTKAEAWTSGQAIEKHLPEFTGTYAELISPGTLYDQKLDAHLKSKAAYEEAFAKLIALEADQAAAEKIAAATFDDSNWQTMDLPAPWKSTDLKSYEGMVWIRKTVDVPAAWAGKDLLLNLGEITSIDVTWFNGQEVGQTGQAAKKQFSRRTQPRTYRVPGELVKAGSNIIAIRVISSLRWGGGFYGDRKKTFNVKPADDTNADEQAVSLTGPWRYLPVHQVVPVAGHPIHRNVPSVLFNGMIHPLIPYAIRGGIWYQGEANTADHQFYDRILSTMITDWRTRWGQGDFPFLIVQLPNFRTRASMPTDDDWTLLREAQARVGRSLPNTGLAVTLDIGESNNIHPSNKQDVGKRLALIAQARVYDKDVVHCGPRFKSFEVKGNEVVVSFDHIHGGLVQKGDKLEGFGLQGDDGKWVWADAKIKGDQVIVSSDKITKPAGVCYGWASNPPSTLYNKAGLPAAQFKEVVK